MEEGEVRTAEDRAGSFCIRLFFKGWWVDVSRRVLQELTFLASCTSLFSRQKLVHEKDATRSGNRLQKVLCWDTCPEYPTVVHARCMNKVPRGGA